MNTVKEITDGIKKNEASQRKTARARRKKDVMEACKRLGLARQTKLAIATEHYKEAKDLAKQGLKMADSYVAGLCVSIDPVDNHPHRLDIRTGSSWVLARVDSIESLNSVMPYGALLKTEEAKELGCFDRFAVLAPIRQFCLGAKYHNDPVLLGVIDAPSKSAGDAVYFLLAEWK